MKASRVFLLCFVLVWLFLFVGLVWFGFAADSGVDQHGLQNVDILLIMVCCL